MTAMYLKKLSNYAVMICIINNWINMLIEIYMDKKKPCTNMNKLYHQTFKLDNVYAVMIRIVND